MLQDKTPGIEEKLKKGSIAGYAGFDPTAPSLHIGHLIPIMLLVHFQRAGNKPIALVGGATGMIGDPSGKSIERNLLSQEELRFNQDCIRKQLSKFLDFTERENAAELVNNYDWFGEMKFLEFLREIGKHLTISYMMAKDSVQNRLESGISFTEFSYQLLQGYDFLWLYENKQCVLQMGGSDQWGNITSGTELVRRKVSGECYALTCPLLTRADGKKFGKSEGGESVWLDPNLTSPYKFYQYWLNASDEDAVKYAKIFSLLSREEIAELQRQQKQNPHERPMQKSIARDITIRVHSEDDYKMAVEASQILFGKATTESLRSLDEKSLLDIFEGVPRATVSRSEVESGLSLVDLLAEKSGWFASKGEVRRLLKAKGVSVNKMGPADEQTQVTADMLLKSKYLLVQKGKKNYYLVEVK